MSFHPSIPPTHPEKRFYVTRSDGTEREPCPCPYGSQFFRSHAEVAWAKCFDRLRIPWEYEPLRFDMGRDHHSYTPDFHLPFILPPNPPRELYLEIKWLHEEFDLTKYILFTQWYAADLLVLANLDRDELKRSRYWICKPKPNPLTTNLNPRSELTQFLIHDGAIKPLAFKDLL